MNLNANPSTEQLRQLIRKCDDAAGHHLLWVAKNGDVELSRIVDDVTPAEFEGAHPEMQVRFETFQAGNEYVGPEAADDDGWISELFNRLNASWKQSKGKSEVAYMGAF